jgi:hypothetical protein
MPLHYWIRFEACTFSPPVDTSMKAHFPLSMPIVRFYSSKQKSNSVQTPSPRRTAPIANHQIHYRLVGYQQNRVPYFHRKTIHRHKYYGPRPITAGSGLTSLKTKAKGQAPEPPSAPPLRPTPLCLVRPPRRHPGARAL